MKTRLVCCLTVLSFLICSCQAELCILGSCTPNCDDGVSRCDCSGACLNDYFGGCNTDYDCSIPGADDTVIITTAYYTGNPTSTATYYCTTETSYYSTITSYNVISTDETYVATQTDVDTQTSTSTTTVAGPTATITARSLDELPIAKSVERRTVKTVFVTRLLVARSPQNQAINHRNRKRTVTSTYYSTDAANYCDQDGFPPCVYTTTQVLVYNQVATTIEDSYYINTVTSVYHTTVVSYLYVTETVTADGYTTTVAAPNNDDSDTPTTPTSTPTSEPDVTVTDNGTDFITATAVASGPGTAANNGGSSDSDVYVTNTQTDLAIATATGGAGNKLLRDLGSQLMGSFAMMLWPLLQQMV